MHCQVVAALLMPVVALLAPRGFSEAALPSPEDRISVGRSGWQDTVVSASGQANPVFDLRLHYIGNVWMGIMNDGTIGSMKNNFGSVLIPDRLRLGIDWNPSFEFPPRTRIDYLWSAGMWFGCIRRTDTLVSINKAFGSDPGTEFFSYDRMLESSSLRSSPAYDAAARAEQQYFARYSDTTVPEYSLDAIEKRRHKPIGLEVHQTSYAWSGDFAGNFILVDWWIVNISSQPISQGIVGIHVAPMAFYARIVEDYAPRELPWLDDIGGFLGTVGGIIQGRQDSVNVAWVADNDGDPLDNQTFGIHSPRGVLGVRVLRAPGGGRFSFNWWGSDLATYTWGPVRFESSRYDNLPGEPLGDRSRYRLMTNGEIDYGQVTTLLDHSMDGWLRPPPDAIARDIANGSNVQLLLSVGPLPDIAPGDSVPFTVAFVAGHGLHTDPRNLAGRFDAGNPRPYLDHLDLSSLITNARWADWVFDNPGVDTDHDGIRGRAYLVNCSGVDTVRYDTTIIGNPPETTIVPITVSSGCDSVFYKGDGVPDWHGPQAPPAPQFELTTTPGKAIMRWNGAFTEIEKDPLSRKRDFEGYRVYAGRFASNEQLSLIASWDREDYKRLAYQPATEEWRQISDLLTVRQWQRLLGDPAFDPARYAVPSLNEAYRDSFWDTTRNLQGEVVGVERRERFSYWGPEAANRPNRYLENDRWETNLIQRVAERDTVVDGEQVTYGVYEVTLDNLPPSVPLYFAVTTFDFGDFEKNVDPMESSPSNNSQYGQPIYSADVVSDSGLHVSVYPNPYKAVYDDAFGNRTTYYAEGYEGRGKSEFTEYDRRVHFINLPDTATITIYSLFGDLIRVIHHPDRFLTTYSSSVGWDLVSRNAQAVTSGIYIYRVDSKLGSQVGKIVIIK